MPNTSHPVFPSCVCPLHLCVRLYVVRLQRYLFCKERLPAGTEFAVLDVLDDLESGARAARDKDRAKKAAQEVRRRACAETIFLVLYVGAKSIFFFVSSFRRRQGSGPTPPREGVAGWRSM